MRPVASVEGEFAAGPLGGPGSSDPERIRGIHLTLKALPMRAYQVRYEQSSGPAWLESARFDLAATVRPGATREQVNEMLRNLLVERFQLVLHHEMRELAVYELVRAKKRVNLREASADGGAAKTNIAPPSKRMGFPEIPAERTIGLWQDLNPAGIIPVTGRNQPVAELIRAIGNQAGRPVVDKTGLAGRYDFILEYANVGGQLEPWECRCPHRRQPHWLRLDDGREPALPLVTEIQEQLGLKLKAAKGAVDVIVIDQAVRVSGE